MIHRIKVDVWRYEVIILTGMTQKEAFAYLELVDQSEVEHAQGLTIVNLPKSKEGIFRVAVWFIDEFPSVNLAAHEMFHVTYFILDFRELGLTRSSEEAFAYLLDFLIEEISVNIWAKLEV